MTVLRSVAPYDWATDCPGDFTTPPAPVDLSSRVYALDAESKARFGRSAA